MSSGEEGSEYRPLASLSMRNYDPQKCPFPWVIRVPTQNTHPLGRYEYRPQTATVFGGLVLVTSKHTDRQTDIKTTLHA